MKKVYLFFSLLLVGILGVQAQSKTWVGGPASDSMWHTAANWSDGVVPTSSDTVVFNNSLVDRIYFNGGASASARVIYLAGVNVVFGIKGGSANTTSTLNVGGTNSGQFSLNALRFTGTAANSLTLTSMRTSAAGCGVILNVLASNRITIPSGRTIHLSSPFASASQDSVSSSGVNQITGTDAGSVVFASGSTCNVQPRNNGANPIIPFGAYTINNIVVFQSGSQFNNNAGVPANPFNTVSGPGTAQFLSGSRFNPGTATSFNALYIMGRTYGTFNITGLANTTNAAFTNTSTTTTTFLDSFIVNTATAFNITLVGDATNAASPTYSFKHIKIASSLAAPNTNIYFRASNANGATAATTFNISGNINIASTAANTAAGTVQLFFGPNLTGNTTTTVATNINFTGNDTLTITKGASPSLVNPGIVMGSPSGGSTMPTNFTINDGASLALGDSLTLRTGNSFSTLTIKPTGRLTLIDNARLVTNHNNNFTIESSAAGTGTIGESNGTILNSGVVNRFIKGNAAWRLLGIPFTLSTKIKGGTNLSSSQFLYLNNIFDEKYIYKFNDTLDNGKYGVGAGVNAGWVRMASDLDSIQPLNGLLAYGSRALGDRTVSYTGFFSWQDTVSVPLSFIPGGKGWNLLSNPYVSNIDFRSIVSNPLNAGVLASNTVYGVNPVGGGGYAFTSFVAATGASVNGGSAIIENGAAFFVRAADVNKLLYFRQSDKTNAAVGTTTGGVTLLGANNNYNEIKVSLVGENKSTDEVLFAWGKFNGASEGFDSALDAYDLGASGTHDLSIVDNAGTRYAIFNGANLQKNTDTRTYKLATKNLQLGTYSFVVAMPKALDKSNEAYIVDTYLGTAVLVKEALVHSFNVTADAASKAEGRFQLEVRKK